MRRRFLIAVPALLVALALPAAPAAAHQVAKPSGCTVGAKRTLQWKVTGNRTEYLDTYADGRAKRSKLRTVRANIDVARIGLTIRACRTRNTKQWRTLDVFAAPSYERQQRDLVTTVKPVGTDGYAVSIRPRKGVWGLGAYPGARTENTVAVRSAVCAKAPVSPTDGVLAAAHGLLSLPIPLPLSGPAGVAAEVGLLAADAALPQTGPDQFQCADAGTVTLPWTISASGTPKNALRAPLYSRTSASQPCQNNPAPAPGTSCQETTETTWTYKRG